MRQLRLAWSWFMRQLRSVIMRQLRFAWSWFMRQLRRLISVYASIA